MKKTKSLAGGLLMLLLLFSCEKIDDYFNEKSLVVNGCQIASIYTPWDDSGGPITKGTFSYNALGQPVSIVFERNCLTGAPAASYLFRYDAAHRLTDFIGVCDGTFDEWHVYKYNSLGQIVQDSIYIWGNMDGNPPSESDFDQSAHYVAYTYDAKDRLTRAIVYWDVPDEGTTTIYRDTTNYNYNSDGNLIRPDANYDDKINICRTNKIWMFLNRDYSRNNYIPALSYNEKGLPLAFPVSYANFPLSLADTGTIKFEYNCTGNSN